MKLYIVATPIGNLADISQRALEILRDADLILCEDTRVTKKLLDRFSISTPTLSYHQHSKMSKVDAIVDSLKEGKTLALVSDAGTPGISDPGNKLIDEVVRRLPGAFVSPIPGPSAVIAALSICGFPTDSFTFYGFIPHKKGKETMLNEIIRSENVAVFFESTHRILKTLEKLKELGLQKNVVICRELTKKFESIYRGTISQAIAQLQQDSTKGEFVVVINKS